MFNDLNRQREFVAQGKGAKNERVAALLKVMVFGRRPTRCLGTLSRLLTCCVTHSPVFCEAVYRVGGLPVLVELLSACTKSASDTIATAEDRQEAERLAKDVIKVLFALGHNDKVLQQVHQAPAVPGDGAADGHDASKDFEAMTKLGLLLGDVLGTSTTDGAAAGGAAGASGASGAGGAGGAATAAAGAAAGGAAVNGADGSPLELKLQAVQLLMHMPAAFGEYMVNKGMVHAMVSLLDEQLEALDQACAAQKEQREQGQQADHELSKALREREKLHQQHICQLCLVLQSVGQNSTTGEVIGGDGGARGALGRLIFPPETEKVLAETRKQIELRDKQALQRAVSLHQQAPTGAGTASAGTASAASRVDGASVDGASGIEMSAIQVELEKIKKRRQEERMHPEENLLDDLGLTEIGVVGINASTVPLRSRLLKLMTSLDSNLKRCSSELLFVACCEDGDLFTRRVGFGNAVHMLQLKGILKQ
jgi:hypothetical protein